MIVILKPFYNQLLVYTKFSLTCICRKPSAGFFLRVYLEIGPQGET